VILSTHIVEDVEELCSRMAIIDKGEILLEAEPTRALDQLRGRIWRRTVTREELPVSAYERRRATVLPQPQRSAPFGRATAPSH